MEKEPEKECGVKFPKDLASATFASATLNNVALAKSSAEEPEIPTLPKTKRKPPAPKPKATPAADAPTQVSAAGAVVDPHFFGALNQTLKRMQRVERANRLSTLRIV